MAWLLRANPVSSALIGWGTGAHFELAYHQIAHCTYSLNLYLLAYSLSIRLAPITHFLLNLLTRSSCIAYWLTLSRTVDLAHFTPSSARIRGSGKNSQCPNVRFASWLYLYRALDCNYLTKCMRRKKYLEFNIVLRKKCIRHLLPSPSRPAAYSISIWCDHWTPTHRVHKCT